MTEHWLTMLRRGTEDRVRRRSKAQTNGALFQWWITIVRRAHDVTVEEINA